MDNKQNKNDPLIGYLCAKLHSCDRESLALYRKLFEPADLNRAAKLLDPQRRAEIHQWVIEANIKTTAALTNTKILNKYGGL